MTKAIRAQVYYLLSEGYSYEQIASLLGLREAAVEAAAAHLLSSNGNAPHELVQKVAQKEGAAIEQLKRLLDTLNRYLEACEECLTDPEDPSRFTLDPAPHDVSVIYTVLVGPRVMRRRAKLSHLLSLLPVEDADGAPITGSRSAEVHTADPRELILKTSAELRQLLDSALKWHTTLIQHQKEAALHDAIVREIEDADPYVAQKIRDAVQRAVKQCSLL